MKPSPRRGRKDEPPAPEARVPGDKPPAPIPAVMHGSAGTRSSAIPLGDGPIPRSEESLTTAKPLTGFLLEEVEEEAAKAGEERYRARQALRWLYQGGALSFGEMTDLPEPARRKFSERFSLTAGEVSHTRVSADGTVKALVRFSDGEVIETVVIPDAWRRTICVSTQAGCPVQCVFCASGIGGLSRQLSAAEIVDQFVLMKRGLAESERLTHAVLMGIGEPLLNYAATVQALKTVNAPWGLGMGYNKITLSTIGILDKIPKLLADGVAPNLAISLHAPTDEIRARIIPTARKTPIRALVEAGLEYRARAKKSVTFEYVLLEGVNDETRHARELGQLLGSKRLKVNLIPFNPVAEFEFRPPSPTRVDAFAKALGACGVFVTVRRRRGGDIDAACGQLRARARPGAPTPGK